MNEARIACISSSRNARILNLAEELGGLGACRLFPYDSYRETHPYWQTKIVKLLGRSEAAWLRYRDARLQEILQEMTAFRPSKILILNVNMTPEQLAAFRALAEVVLWFVDPVRDVLEEQRAAWGACRVFAYDRESVACLQRQGIAASYCPVGYHRAYAASSSPVQSEWDITFVGSPYRTRLQMLEPLAAAAEARGWQFRAFGPFFEARHIWKRASFRRKWPHLARHLTNGTFSSEEIADIYRRSRICLNLHGNGSTGVNPRTFEILACGAMEIIDARGDYDVLQPGVDVAVFRDVPDLVEIVAWHLSHEAERAAMAAHGHARICEARSMQRCLQQLLGGA